MQFSKFTPAIAAMVMAHMAQAAPSHMGRRTENQTYPTYPTQTGSTPEPTGLSKTAQILLSDTVVDAVNNVLTDDWADFVFDFKAEQSANPPGEGGQIVTANRKTMPALTNQGIGMAVGFVGPCGFNTPHVHPRATELLIVTKGELVSEMVIENGIENQDGTRRNIRNLVGEYQMTPFFQGSIHSQFNPNCDDVIFVAPQSNEDFGVNQVVDSLAALDTDTIRATVGNFIDGSAIDEFRDKISPSVALGVEQCLKKCGIQKR